MPQLTLAGVPILYDFNQTAQDFLDKSQKLKDLVRFTVRESTSRNTWQTNPARPDQRVGLPRYNWPEPPEFRINQLYWPCTGASRWAFGFFLMNGEGRQQLLKADCTQPKWLISTTSSEPPIPGTTGTDDIQFSAKVWILEPHRIYGCSTKQTDLLGVTATYDLWLIPVVDWRYWLAFRNAGDIVGEIGLEETGCADACDTWLTLLTYLNNQAGVDPVQIGTVPTGYYKPDCRSWDRPYDNIGLALDAAASSIGCRMVFRTDGEVRVEDFPTAQTVLEQNLATVKNQIAGFDCFLASCERQNQPASVDVVFPRMKCNHVLCDSSVDVVNVAGTAPCGDPDSVKTIHCPGFYADYECDCLDPATDTPTNQADLDYLAAKIAADYYSSILYEYDFTFSSPIPWVPSAIDDSMIVMFGVEEQDHFDAATAVEQGAGEMVAHTALQREMRRLHQTRIQALPLMCDVDSQLSGNDQNILPDRVLVEICEDDCWGSDDCCAGSGSGAASDTPSVNANIVRWCDCAWTTDSGQTIRIYAPTAYPGDEKDNLATILGDNCLPLNAGCCDKVWVEWDCQSSRWVADVKYDDIWRFELTENLCRGGCAEAKLYLTCCGDTDPRDTGITFTVCDSQEIICANKSYSDAATSSGDVCGADSCGCVPAGTKGVARHFPDKCRWEVLSLEICDESQQLWVEATECIYPNDTGEGDLYRRDSTGDLTLICSGITVDNSECLILAVPGERFPVEASSCAEDNTFRPSSQYGTTRRVRVYATIDCGLTGLASVLPGEDCNITIRNNTNRHLACGGTVGGSGSFYEDVTVYLDSNTCEFVAYSSERPTTATATLRDPLCSSTRTGVITSGSASFPTVCSWTEEIVEAGNPYNLAGCAGSKVELRRNEGDADCAGRGWDIVQVQHYPTDLIANILSSTTCTGSGGTTTTACGIDKVVYKDVPIMNCAACGSTPAAEAAITFQIENVLVVGDFLGEDCMTPGGSGMPPEVGLSFTARKVCVLPTCNDPDTVTDLLFTGKKVYTDIYKDGCDLKGDTCIMYSPAACDCTTEVIVQGTDCGSGSGSGTCT